MIDILNINNESKIKPAARILIRFSSLSRNTRSVCHIDSIRHRQPIGLTRFLISWIYDSIFYQKRQPFCFTIVRTCARPSWRPCAPSHVPPRLSGPRHLCQMPGAVICPLPSVVAFQFSENTAFPRPSHRLFLFLPKDFHKNCALFQTYPPCAGRTKPL